MDRHRTLPMTLALLLAFSGLLLAHPPVFGDSLSLEETYAPWKERIRAARTELDALKAQRQKVQREYDTLRAEFYVRSFADPDKDAKLRAQMADLDNKIRDKEYEITTTIPDEARRAGVPSSALSQ